MVIVETMKGYSVITHKDKLYVDHILVARSKYSWTVIERPESWVCISGMGSLVIVVEKNGVKL